MKDDPSKPASTPVLRTTPELQPLEREIGYTAGRIRATIDETARYLARYPAVLAK
jgi:hypothetical protein